MRPLAVVLALLLVLGIGSAVLIALQRSISLEAPREVAVVLDYTAALTLAGKLGYEPRDFVRRLADAGATALGVSEVSMEDLPYRPGVTVREGYELLQELPPGGDGSLAGWLQDRELLAPWYTYVLTADGRFAAFLAEWAERRLGPGRAEVVDPARDGLRVVVLRGVPTVTRADLLWPDETWQAPALRFGFWEGDLAAARELGLAVVAVLGNDPLLAPEHLEPLLSPLGRTTVLITGGVVPGYPDRMAETARVFRDLGLTPGMTRDWRQRGFAYLAAALDYRGVKFRDVRTGRPVGEYADAARERETRGLYFVPALFPGPAAATVEGNRSDLAALAGALTRAGYRPGAVWPLTCYRPHPGLVALVGAGVAAGGLALAGTLVPRRGRRGGAREAAAAALAVVLAAGVAYLWPGTGREALALLAATVFPAWAVLAAIERHRAWPISGMATRALAGALLAAACAVAGGLLVNGLLGDTGYVLEARLFWGVKLAHALPPVIVLGALLATRGRDLWRRELTLGGFLLGAGLAVAAAVYVTRTGNEPVLAPTAAELRLREVLEQWLVVRPRFREFLVGYPALGLLPLALASGRREWTLGLALLATVGQVSVVNSFAHVHTPVELSLVRTVLGLVLGLALGLAGLAVLSRWTRKGAEP